MCSLRHDQRPLGPCFSTNHSPAPQSFSSVLSTNRCLGSAWDGGLTTAKSRLAGSASNGPVTGSLAEALLKALEGQVDTEQAALIGARLARGPSALGGLLDDLGIPDQENILLLVDQFEETFRYQRNDEADAFVALLLASVAQRRRRIYGVITMRSDFFGECSRFPGLAEAINDSQFLAPRLTRAQLRAAIEGPASVYDGHEASSSLASHTRARARVWL
jgi:hypothetical protein